MRRPLQDAAQKTHRRWSVGQRHQPHLVNRCDKQPACNPDALASVVMLPVRAIRESIMDLFEEHHDPGSGLEKWLAPVRAEGRQGRQPAAALIGRLDQPSVGRIAIADVNRVTQLGRSVDPGKLASLATY